MAGMLSALDPVGRLQRIVEAEAGPPFLRRLEAELEQRPALPRLGMAMVVLGLALIIALTITAGALGDGIAQPPTLDTLDAQQFRPWFRITLLTGAAVILMGILTILLSITVRIWWLAKANQTLLPVAVDALRVRNGRAPLTAGPVPGDEGGRE